MKKILVIGGGTGTAVVLTGLKMDPEAKLAAVVTVADSGGSTGRLRDEFGFLPVGDVRQCLAALADGDDQNSVRKVLLYRFNKGSGLKGHNLGNLILTALEDLSDSPGHAIETASKIFRVRGKVYPITEKPVDLVIKYQDGIKKIGEKMLDNPSLGGKKIKSISLSPPAKIYWPAKMAMMRSDVIVLGPGDLYASLLVNCLAQGFEEALQKSPAKFVYIINLMTHYSQTHQMTAQDHLDEVTKYSGRQPDVVIINNGNIPKPIIEAYQKNNEFVVQDDLPKTTKNKMKIIRDNLVSKVVVKHQDGDALTRSLLRHDQAKLASILLKL